MQAGGDYSIAFRVVWRVNEDKLAHAWDSIVSQRHLCDEIVAQTPSLQMFVSCISGVFSKGAVTKPATRPVFPAVSYWAVFDSATVDEYDDLGMRIVAICPSVEIKSIKSQLRRPSDTVLAADCEPLFIALKDHCSRFIIEKITRSLLATGAAACATAQPPNAKLAVVSRSKYRQQLPASVEALNAVGLCIVLEVLETPDDS